jgi:predicted RNA binding protein YcfA (HicA-like mRNA interferase family)
MSSVPVLKPQEVVQILESIGFVEVRQKGSHKQFRHPDGRATTVPFHKVRMLITDFIDRPTMGEIVHDNLGNPNSR